MNATLKTLVIGQNQSFDEFSKGGTLIVYSFASPLVTNILCSTDGVKQVALKAADFFRVDDDNNALCANLSNKIKALENDPIPLPYIRCTVSADQNMGVP